MERRRYYRLYSDSLTLGYGRQEPPTADYG